jgi:3-oxoadipate enol-lactonase
MSEINVDGCRIHAEVEGPERAPVLVLSNSLATTLHMWEPQVSAITQHFRLVRYDPRGHGLSDVPAGPYTMERLGRDALAILDSLGINKVSWCGLSMGGMVGQWLGANAPERIERLVLSNTSSYFADKADRDNRLKLVREKGIAAFSKANMERWFTQGFRERSPQTVAWIQEMFAATPLEGYVACAQVVRDMDHRDPHQLRQLGDIHRDPPRLIFGEQLRSRPSPRLILEIDIGKLLPVVVADDKAGVQFLDRRWKAALTQMNIAPKQP